ncbi:flagellar hook-length control protein FliK [Paenibacillus sp. P96]|uniref:Flagellar hook-length control protein FliK n=1 Tax=Paenibacillus zeirhizosphaerae TaxID=2987519 RepID=A0ABT9FS85_9BACL|nr:flagellar hook-length control protein FliK [Paenibacillus sp. P96]MDP4097540.1 flagellar hook-length control protein FliK [Paenibacillus sp. P96]
MSTIPNNLGAPTARIVAKAGSSSTSSPAQGSSGFNETLVQVIGAGQNAGAAPGLMASSVQLLAGIGGALEEEGTGTELLEMLPDLMNDLDQLDDLLQSNPELFSALQAWVAGVQQYLNRDAGSADAEMGATLNLAEHPATIRFALQDSLAQLLNAATDEEKSQAMKLLQSLQTIVEPAQSFETEMMQSQAADSSDSNALFQLKVQQGGPQSGQNGDGFNRNTQAGQEIDAASSEQADEMPLNNVTTAGQLAIQNNGTAPALAEKPVVHVRQFAKEMTEFVVQKLDIVKQSGLSEATIMLRPDHLGQLEVKLSMSNGQLVAQFMTEHIGAKDLLEQQMSHLRASLHNQGIQVSKVEVTHNESLSSHLYQQDQGSGANQQQQERRSRSRGKEENEDALKAAEMAEELRSWTKEQRLNGTGQSSFTAQA